MKIESVRIENLRSIRDETIILDNHTTLVGANGSGKSTVLCALNIFFAAPEDMPTSITDLSEEDFHNRSTSRPVRVTLTFTNLSKKETTELSHYVRKGNLVVTAHAEFDSERQKAKVKHFGQRLACPEFANYFKRDKEGAKAPELKQIYQTLRERFEDLPSEKTKGAMNGALREYEAGLDDRQLELIASEDDFYGANGTGVLRQFIEWVYVPAVKDASSEAVEGTGIALKKLIARSVSERSEMMSQIEQLQEEARESYKEVLRSQESVLNELSEKLETGLKIWAHPDANIKLAWKDDPEKSVRVQSPQASVSAGEGAFLGEISRQGHGLQRSYLMALLEILSPNDLSDAPALILGCEEPELYQHPPQARHLSSVLEGLASRGSQVIITTHSPYFVSSAGFEGIRHVKRGASSGAATVVKSVRQGVVENELRRLRNEGPVESVKDETGERAKIMQLLQPSLNEMFFTREVVFVEGLEDMAYIRSWMSVNGYDEAFRRSGRSLVRTDGKSTMVKAAVIAKKLEIPVHVVFDGDHDVQGKEGAPKHEKENLALGELMGAGLGEAFPVGGHISDGFWMWAENVESDTRREFVESIGQERYNRIVEGLHSKFGQVGGLKKNSLFIGEKLMALKAEGATCAKLDELCGRLSRTG